MTFRIDIQDVDAGTDTLPIQGGALQPIATPAQAGAASGVSAADVARIVAGGRQFGIAVSFDEVEGKLDFSNRDRGSDAVKLHKEEDEPHPQYLLEEAIQTLIDDAVAAAIAAHLADPDPHPQYTGSGGGGGGGGGNPFIPIGAVYVAVELAPWERVDFIQRNYV